MKVKKQLKSNRRFPSKTSTKGTSYFKGGSSSKTKNTSKKEKEKSARLVKEVPKKTDGVGRKCFKCHDYGHLQANCPNWRVMTLHDIEKINLELQVAKNISSQNGSESEENKEIVEKAYDGQRENIVHTRSTINEKVCMVIIDGWSSTNVVSTTLIDKLKLPTSKHHQPYKLQWLNEGSDLKVTKQAFISF